MDGHVPTAFTRTKPPPYQEGYVSLHVLCDHCQAIGLERTENSWLFEAQDTAANFVARSSLCHLCMLLLSQLDPGRQRDKTQDEQQIGTVRFVARRRLTPGPPWDSGKRIVQIDVFTKIFHVSGSAANIVLIPYSCSESNRFEGYLESVCAPKRPNYNVLQLQEWLQTCVSGHPGCSEFQRQSTRTSEGPSRLLQIEQDQVRLQCDLKQKHYPYVTLSHMWGTEPSRQLILKEADLATYQTGIALDTLPAIFREAVHLTRLLGYVYIWIDSLCIIQDSSADWQVEAPKMAAIYGNAICNLACLLPPQRFESHQPLDPRTCIPCVVRPATDQRSGLYVMRGDIYSRSYTRGFACKWHEPVNWPLFSRAWTCQEHFLSPRTIFFGHEALILECSDTTRDTWLGKINTDRKDSIPKSSFFNELFKLRSTPPDPMDVAAISRSMRAWHTLIKDYRSRHLTEPDDRVMAFAGVAHAAHSLTQLTYIAGLWVEYLPFCLLWTIKTHTNHPTTMTTNHQPAETHVTHRVPSWTWFSIPHSPSTTITLDFLTTFERSNHTFPETAIRWADVTSIQWPSHSSRQTRNSYHAFQGLQITLTMPTCRASTILSDNGEINPTILSHYAANLESHIYIASSEASHALPKNRFTFYSDGDGEMSRETCLGVVYQSKSAHYHQAAGLCLVESGEAGMWQRVGVWTMHVNKASNSAWTMDTFSPCFEEIGGVEVRAVTLV